MKSRKIVVTAIAAVAITIGGILFAADHNDSPTVKNQPTDITDVYVFQATDPNNLVFVANTQGLLAPSATAAAAFDPNTLIEIKIDNNGDNVEDLVIQAIYANGKMNIYGPVSPSMTGTMSKVEGAITASVDVTPYSASSPVTATGSNGIKVFAGPRDDPFFFDLDQFKAILAGTATSFNNPGTDTFAGTNVMSVVVEVPKTLLNATTGKINVWLTTNKKV
ncbi:MAG: DUF4331 family protein [Bacteroidetes bacterium]|nr:DUF4331 family protein [Bacteroidota bacterium]